MVAILGGARVPGGVMVHKSIVWTTVFNGDANTGQKVAPYGTQRNNVQPLLNLLWPGKAISEHFHAKISEGVCVVSPVDAESCLGMTYSQLVLELMLASTLLETGELADGLATNRLKLALQCGWAWKLRSTSYDELATQVFNPVFAATFARNGQQVAPTPQQALTAMVNTQLLPLDLFTAVWMLMGSPHLSAFYQEQGGILLPGCVYVTEMGVEQTVCMLPTSDKKRWRLSTIPLAGNVSSLAIPAFSCQFVAR
jgi:hypothetical protein